MKYQEDPVVKAAWDRIEVIGARRAALARSLGIGDTWKQGVNADLDRLIVQNREALEEWDRAMTAWRQAYVIEHATEILVFLDARGGSATLTELRAKCAPFAEAYGSRSLEVPGAEWRPGRNRVGWRLYVKPE